MTRLPPKPDLEWQDDGTPVDRRTGDVYFSRHDGLEESRTVFLKACGLPERWQGKAQFTIGEFGFGTGLNFLAAWQLWRETRAPGQWLHFVSFEGYPLDAEDAARALEAWPALGDLPAKLVAAWPERAFGVQRMIWPDERVALTLHTGDIAETIPASSLMADAWFLDGFSPAKNEEMWEEGLWAALRERCSEEALLGTFTVAGAVRRGLAGAGFEVEKKSGYGRKRERLEVRSSEPQPPLPDVFGLRPLVERPGKVRIIGAGVAGAAAARVLLDRGLAVEVVDAGPGPATGASGNPIGLVMPRLDAGDTVQARLLIDAYLAACRFYAGRPGVKACETAQRPKDDREAERIAKVLADPPLGLERLEALSGGGQLHKGSLIIKPSVLIPALLDGADLTFNTQLTEADLRDGVPTVLAAGEAITRLVPWLQVQGRLGQVEACTVDVEAPPSAIASGDYAVAAGRQRLWGATFEAWDGTPPTPSDAARALNMAALEGLDPWWRQQARSAGIVSRAGVRATTPDRLPLIGRLPLEAEALEIFDGVRNGQPANEDAPLTGHLLIAGGFGSRGFTWGPWAGEILAGQLLGEPAPATMMALQAVSPMRQILRRLKRGG